MFASWCEGRALVLGDQFSCCTLWENLFGCVSTSGRDKGQCTEDGWMDGCVPAVLDGGKG